mgnify:CR=1 FL=1
MVNAEGTCGTQAQGRFLVRYDRHQGIVWTKGVDTLEGAHTELRAFRHAGVRAWMELPALEPIVG